MEMNDNVVGECENDAGVAGSIQAIGKGDVHRICSGQVVLNLATAVKELVENSLDAGATHIEVRLKEHGSDLVEVVDDGSGVEESNLAGLTLKHHTSKIREFSDVVGVDTFGFRGEALSSLCALSNLKVVSCHKSASVGTRLEYDHNGKITSQTPFARQHGTTVSLGQLFHTLPVRHKEFLRNLKKEYARMVQVLNAYCLIATGVRITCTNQVAKGKKNVVVSTNGNDTMKENITNIFGIKQVQTVLDFVASRPTEDICAEYNLKVSEEYRKHFKLSGFVSSSEHGKGRSSTDRQFFFINNRPCDPPKVTRLVNEVYHMYNRHQYPFVLLDISLHKESVDVNVTPDKRQVFMQQEKLLLATLKSSLIAMFDPISSTYQVNTPTSAGSISAAFARSNSSPAQGATPNHCDTPTSASLPSNKMSSLSKLKRSYCSTFSKDCGSMQGIQDTNKQRKLDAFMVQGSENSPSPTLSRDLGITSAPSSSHEFCSQDEGSASPASLRVPVVSTDDSISEDNDGSASAPSLSVLMATTDHIDRPEKNSISADNKEVSSQRISSINLSQTESRLNCTLDTLKHSPSAFENNDHISVESTDMANHVQIHDSEPNASQTSPTICRISDSLANSTPESRRMSSGVLAMESRISSLLGKRTAVKGSPRTMEASGDRMTALLAKRNSWQRAADNASDNDGQQEDQTDDVEIEASPESRDITQEHVVDLTREHTVADDHGPVHQTGRQATYDAASELDRRIVTVPFSIAELREKNDKKSGNCDRKRIEGRGFHAKIDPSDNKSAEEELKREFSKDMFDKMEILGQFNLGFIIARLGQDLFIIDQHATDEKYNFETLQKDTVIKSQKLIQPQHMEFTSVNEGILIDNLEIFHKNGFDFAIDEAAAPTQRVKLSAVPVSRNWTFGKPDIEEMLFMLQDSPGVLCRPTRVRDMFASRACHKSVTIGTALNPAEMRKLVAHMGDLEQPWNCPHGRPTMRHLLNLNALAD